MLEFFVLLVTFCFGVVCGNYLALSDMRREIAPNVGEEDK